MAKTTTKTTGLTNAAEFESTLDAIADLTVRRDKAKAKLDKAIMTAREEHGGDVEELNNQIASKMALAESFALRNRAILLPGDGKSGETKKARFGFRLGNPVLVLLNRKFNWKGVCEKLIEAGKLAFIKLSEPKPDKDRIKAEMSDEEMASFGLRVEQTEGFWVEPKTDTAERIKA